MKQQLVEEHYLFQIMAVAWADDTGRVPPTLLKEIHLKTNSMIMYVVGYGNPQMCRKEPNSKFANSDCDGGKFLFSSLFNVVDTSLLISL